MAIDKPQQRIPLGSVQIDGRDYPVTISSAWYRVLFSLFNALGGASGLDVTSIDAGSYAAMQPLLQEGIFSDIPQPSVSCQQFSGEMIQQSAVESFMADLMQGLDIQAITSDIQQAECMQVADFPIFQE